MWQRIEMILKQIPNVRDQEMLAFHLQALPLQTWVLYQGEDRCAANARAMSYDLAPIQYPSIYYQPNLLTGCK